jgi:hypothetical protein
VSYLFLINLAKLKLFKLSIIYTIFLGTQYTRIAFFLTVSTRELYSFSDRRNLHVFSPLCKPTEFRSILCMIGWDLYGQ